VVHAIPLAADAGPSQCADRHGKGPRGPSPDQTEESDEGTDVDVYLKMIMFTTQLVQIF
jgi:hypothetical protein